MTRQFTDMAARKGQSIIGTILNGVPEEYRAYEQPEIAEQVKSHECQTISLQVPGMVQRNREQSSRNDKGVGKGKGSGFVKGGGKGSHDGTTPGLCKFYVKGNCSMKSGCQYSHDAPHNHSDGYVPVIGVPSSDGDSRSCATAPSNAEVTASASTKTDIELGAYLVKRGSEMMEGAHRKVAEGPLDDGIKSSPRKEAMHIQKKKGPPVPTAEEYAEMMKYEKDMAKWAAEFPHAGAGPKGQASIKGKLIRPKDL